MVKAEMVKMLFLGFNWGLMPLMVKELTMTLFLGASFWIGWLGLNVNETDFGTLFIQKNRPNFWWNRICLKKSRLMYDNHAWSHLTLISLLEFLLCSGSQYYVWLIFPNLLNSRLLVKSVAKLLELDPTYITALILGLINFEIPQIWCF